MPIHRYFLSDFVTIQRQSFFELLEKGLIEEFSKRNPITNTKKELEFLFYPEYYILTRPEYTPQEAIFKNKSYTSKLFVPGQLTDLKSQKKILKWFYIGNLPLMTKRGHFILNGAARVIVNQILRSPGIYYQQKIYENYEEKWSQKPDDSYKRFYTDLICMRGTWLRIEIDKDKNIWAQMKKGPKIPIYWFLLAMGLSEKKIFKTITDSYRLLGNLSNKNNQLEPKQKNKKYAYLKNPPEAWQEIFKLLSSGSSLVSNTIKKNKDIETNTFSLREKSEETTSISTSSASLPLPARHSVTRSSLCSGVAAPSMASLRAKRGGSFHSSPSMASHPLWGREGSLQSHRAPNGESSHQVPFSPLEWEEKQAAKPLGLPVPVSNEERGEEQEKEVKKSGLLLQGPSNGQRASDLFQRRGVDVALPDSGKNQDRKRDKNLERNLAEEGRKWLYNKFMNPRSYNLGKQGRLAFNRKLGLNISTIQTTLTGLDVLYATDYLIKVEKGIFKIDDIDHLKNRRVRTSGELIQIQIGVGIVRLEKAIRENLNKLDWRWNKAPLSAGTESRPLFERPAYEAPLSAGTESRPELCKKAYEAPSFQRSEVCSSEAKQPFTGKDEKWTSFGERKAKQGRGSMASLRSERAPSLRSKSSHRGGFLLEQSNDRMEKNDPEKNILINFVNSKAFNSAIREFFGTSPLSQFMDQINPLAELTHKRRLSSMGPGGVTRDTATLAIRGIHPTHYGRICPIETPEGKNTGLVNSMTTYARVNSNGIIESPFYKVYKGQVQKNTGMYYFSAEQEEKIKLAAADLTTSSIGFLPKSFIPVRIAEDFTKIPRSQVQYVGISPLQMISIAASLIPFLEHDDANRALMGSNMQRQAVPLIKPERPIVGTGLEARAISDSGHAILAKFSGLVTYVSSDKIVICSLVSI
jgi:DNA-directed RNA polymerase beta subunit